jgi:glycerate 2-kinase
VRLLVAPDSFKGTLRASEVCAAVARGIEAAGLEPPDSCPLADGGEGTMEALLLASGGETAGATVRDPLGREIRAGFALLEDGGTAVVEVAAASGLALVAEDERDAEAATSHGTGDLIAAAVDAGAQVVLVGVGGSATTDGGAGAIEALSDAGGPRGAQIVVLADVRTPFERAAAVFAPQKGADPAAVRRLEKRLERRARDLPRDPRGVPMSGAAGGISGGLWAAFGARLEPGAPFVLDAVGYDERARAAFAVVLGEGRLDETTLHGKAVFEAATRARQMGVPAHAIAGQDGLDPFGKRIMDLQHVLTATDTAELEAAGERLARLLVDETRPG